MGSGARMRNAMWDVSITDAYAPLFCVARKANELPAMAREKGRRVTEASGARASYSASTANFLEIAQRVYCV
jgi:hypothetical protein